MMGAKQKKFCGAVARALLIGVKFGGVNEGLIGRSYLTLCLCAFVPLC